jgi:hypothetical protein
MIWVFCGWEGKALPRALCGGSCFQQKISIPFVFEPPTGCDSFHFSCLASRLFIIAFIMQVSLRLVLQEAVLGSPLAIAGVLMGHLGI